MQQGCLSGPLIVLDCYIWRSSTAHNLPQSPVGRGPDWGIYIETTILGEFFPFCNYISYYVPDPIKGQ